LNKKDYMKQYAKKYYSEHKEGIKKRNRQYYKDNFERFKEWKKQWQEKNPEYMKQYRKNNIENTKNNYKKWVENNPEKNLKRHRQWMDMKRKTDLMFNLNCNIRKAMWRALKGNKAGRHWEDLIDYNLKDLYKRLKKTIPEGYTWQDYLESKLHIDHIIPISVFNFTKPEHTDFKRCWALDNLRLLPAEENLRKNNKLFRPFQPALAI